MRASKLALLLLTLLPLAAVPAKGGVQLEAISWQSARWHQGKLEKPQDIAELKAQPDAPLKGRVIAKLKLLNRGPNEAEGILLRYSVTPKIAPQGQSGTAAWAVPFVVEERRVPKVGPNQVVDVPIDSTSYIDLNLRRLAREGYWASELKIDVMLVPRKGDEGPLQVISSRLPVAAP